MLVNIVGHKLDGNYELWKYVGQKTERGLLCPGLGGHVPHSVGQDWLFWVVLKGHCIEFKYYADGIHSGLTPPGNNS